MTNKKNPTEEEIVKGCLRQDRRSMEILYKTYFSPLYAVAARYARDGQQVRGILNTAFLKAFQNLHTFQTGRPLYPWLKTIVVRTGLDELRGEFRRQITADIEEVETVYAEAELAERLDAETVNFLLRQLPPLAQAVFNLFAFEGYSHGEIAEKLDISENNSRWNLHSARQQLKNLLAQYESTKKLRVAVA